MYNQGFSRTIGDDILSSLMKNSPPAASNKATTFAPSSLQEDEDPFDRRTSNIKPTYNVGSRRLEDNRKLADDVDDLLDLIEGGPSKQERTSSKPPLPGRGGSNSPLKNEMGSTGNRFYDEFGDEDNFSSYVPAQRDSRSIKPALSNSDEVSKKRSHLFGLPDQSLTQTVRTSESIDQGLEAFGRRPQTSDPKATMGMDSGIGEIQLSVSRRGGRNKSAKDVNRPFTSPGILEKPESQFSEDRSAAGTPLVQRKGRGPYDLEDDGESDYLSGIGNRDRADSKKSLTTVGGGFNIDHDTGTRGDFGRKDYLRADNATAYDGTPKKSPMSEYGRREPYFPGSRDNLDDHRQDFPIQRTATANTRKDFLDTGSQLMSHTSQAGSISNLGQGATGGGRRNRGGEGTSKLDSGHIRVEDDIAHLVRNQIAPSGGTGQGTTGGSHTPMRDASIMINEPGDMRGGFIIHDTAGRDFAKESEEYYKKRMKDAEQHYEKRFEDLKKALEDEKKKWEANYIKEIEQLKKEKDELKESAKVQVDRERDRLKEIFNLELESKDKLHKYELERQKHLLEEQNEGLKRQLEAQTRLNALADEVRTSSNKLMSLTERLDQDKNKEGQGKKSELSERERKLEEGEIKLKHEQTMWEGEKKRLEKLRTEVEEREAEVQKMLEKERELIRREYHRLTELQDSIKDQEVEKRKKLEAEKKNWEQEKSKLEEETRKIKEEYLDKYKQMELEVELFETQKQEFEELIAKSETALKQKHEEVDVTRKRLTIQEAEMLRRMKTLEHQELIFKKESEELQSKLGLLEIERLSFEKERMEMRGVVEKARDDMNIMNKFKREFELEKEKNMKMKLEMDSFARNMQNEREKIHEEKTSLSMLHKTLENLRYNYVKEFAVTGPKPYINTISAPETLTIGKENSAPVGLGLGGYQSKQMNGFGDSYTRSKSPENGQRTLLGSRKIISEPIANKYTYVNEIKREELKPKNFNNFGNTLGEKKDGGVSKLTTAKPFNYHTYMDQIKQYDQTSSLNQNYIAMEKEGLMKNKIDYGSGSLLKLKSIGTSDASLRSSPQFKASSGLNEL